MPQAGMLQAFLTITGLPAGTYEFKFDPIVTAAPQFQQLVQKAPAGSFTTVAIPAGCSFCFVGFDPTNTQAIRIASVSADQGVWIGPTGWVALSVVNQPVASQLVLQNSGGSNDVTVQVVLL
jgi:hypothetical protein